MFKGIPTLMFTRGSIMDPDALAFITNVGITDATQKSAINQLVTSAKAHSWWGKCLAIYPFIGGSSSTCKYNLKDPRDVDGAYRLTFYGAPTFASTGVDWDGVSDYALTHLIPANTDLGLHDMHISYYSRENVDENKNWIGAYDSGGGGTGMSMNSFFGTRAYINGSDPSPTISVADTSGYFLCTRVVSTGTDLYRNGSNIVTITGGAGHLSPYTIAIGTAGFFGSYAGESTEEGAFATVGYGISAGLAAQMYTDIQAFQTTLGRQV